MAKLYITEYQFMGAQGYGESNMPRDGNGTIHQAPVDFTGGATPSEAFGQNTAYIEIWSDADCLYAIGTDPDADDGGTPLTAKTSKFVGVPAGGKLSVVAIA